MISTPDRRKAIELIDEARANGARLKPACEMLGISPRTYQHWQWEGDVPCDGRRTAVRPKPAHALSEAEEQAIIDVQPASVSGPAASSNCGAGGRCGALLGLGVDTVPGAAQAQAGTASGPWAQGRDTAAADEPSGRWPESGPVVGHHMAARVLEQALLKELCFNQPLVLHSDNGSPFKGTTLRAQLTASNIELLYSPPPSS